MERKLLAKDLGSSFIKISAECWCCCNGGGGDFGGDFGGDYGGDCGGDGLYNCVGRDL